MAIFTILSHLLGTFNVLFVSTVLVCVYLVVLLGLVIVTLFNLISGIILTDIILRHH